MKLFGGRGKARSGKVEALFLGIALVATAAAMFVVLSPPDTPADGETRGARIETAFGPLEDNDRILLGKVRQAGLWEMPSGQQAVQRGKSARVKQIGQMIADQHAQLDADTRVTAGKLGVILPSRPNADQEGWMREMSGKFGDEYDRVFVLRLREAHGAVFSVIAKVRAETRNTLIRAYAERCLRFVQTHMSLLESTGLVTDEALR